MIRKAETLSVFFAKKIFSTIFDKAPILFDNPLGLTYNERVV